MDSNDVETILAITGLDKLMHVETGPKKVENDKVKRNLDHKFKSVIADINFAVIKREVAEGRMSKSSAIKKLEKELGVDYEGWPVMNVSDFIQKAFDGIFTEHQFGVKRRISLLSFLDNTHTWSMPIAKRHAALTIKGLMAIFGQNKQLLAKAVDCKMSECGQVFQETVNVLKETAGLWHQGHVLAYLMASFGNKMSYDHWRLLEEWKCTQMTTERWTKVYKLHSTMVKKRHVLPTSPNGLC